MEKIIFTGWGIPGERVRVLVESERRRCRSMAERLEKLYQGYSLAILSTDTQLVRTAAQILARQLRLGTEQVHESNALNFNGRENKEGPVKKTPFFELVEKYQNYEVVLVCMPTELVGFVLQAWSERYPLELQEFKTPKLGTVHMVEVRTGIVHTLDT